MLKNVLKRGLIIGLAFVLIACVGGIAPLDLPVILIVAILVILLGIVSYLSHNRRNNDE